MNLIQIFPQDEIWTPLPEILFPNVVPQQYMVSTYGNIFNKKTNSYLPSVPPPDNRYITISLSSINGDHIFAQPHRIVLMTFNYIEGCESLDVNHKDGIKYHNWIWNLEWNTRSQNIQHAINNNLFNLGETRGNSKYKNEQIEEVCLLISKGYTTEEITNKTSIDSKTVQNIKNGHCWKHISQKYDFSNMSVKNHFSDNDIENICKLFEKCGTDIGTKDVLTHIGSSINYDNLNSKEKSRINACISSIRRKKTFKNICNKYNY